MAAAVKDKESKATVNAAMLACKEAGGRLLELDSRQEYNIILDRYPDSCCSCYSCCSCCSCCRT